MDSIHWDPLTELPKFDDIRMTVDENGLFHSKDDKPSFIGYTKDQPKKRRIWVDEETLCELINRGNGLFVIDESRLDRDKTIKFHIIYMHRNVCVMWHKHGILHRDGDKPAMKMRVGPTIKELTVWYQNGRIHRDGDKPAFIANIIGAPSFLDRIYCMKKWYNNGVIHRDIEPAIIESTFGNAPHVKIWVKQGELYRPPNNNGERMPISESYRIDSLDEGKAILLQRIWKDHSEDLHNVEENFRNGNRVLFWVKDIQIKTCGWNKNNILFDVTYSLHRRTGPAWVAENEKYYFIDNNEVNQFAH